jgi:transcription initiation factor TFIIIB Brf1 subunit/transcription initiation factor TFIIB
MDVCGQTAADVSKACNELECTLICNPTWKKLFETARKPGASRYMDIVSPMISRLNVKDENLVRVIYKTISKIVDRIENDHVIIGLQPTTYGAGLVYVAVMAAKSTNPELKKITMNMIAKVSNITLTSIIHAEKEIMAAIFRCKTIK